MLIESAKDSIYKKINMRGQTSVLPPTFKYFRKHEIQTSATYKKIEYLSH